jgi:cytochrome c2
MTTMPTSDADRYAQLLRNLAVRIGAIREAIERAFGVTLTEPTRVLPGTTMSARLSNPQDRADVVA